MRFCTFFGRENADFVKIPIIVCLQAGIVKLAANISTIIKKQKNKRGIVNE